MQEMDGAKLILRNAVRAAEVVRLRGLAALGGLITGQTVDQSVDWYLRSGQACHVSSIGERNRGD